MKRQQRIVPLALPQRPEHAAMVSARLAEFVRAFAGDRLVALFDIEGGAAGHRAAIEAAIGAERCVVFDSRSIYQTEMFRWEFAEPGQIHRPIGLVIVLSAPSTYLSALKSVHDRFHGRPPVVLPHANVGQPPDAAPAIFEVPLGDDAPVGFVLVPFCGSGRVEPVVRTLMTWLEKRRLEAISPCTNRRFVASFDVPPIDYGPYRELRRAIDEGYLRFVELMESDCWTVLHDHISAEALARAPFCKMVALYRDPRDYINSLYHWYCDPRHGDAYRTITSVSKEEGFLKLFEGMGTRSVAGDGIGQLPSFADVAANFVAFRKHANILPISYEEARLDPRPLYRRMIAWLGLEDVAFRPIPDASLDEVISMGSFAVQSGGAHNEGSTEGYYQKETLGRVGLRKGVVGDWKNHFTPKVKERAKMLIGEALIELGYEKDMSW